MRIRPLDLVDVFVYLVVLGVFIEFFPEVISETFVLALLTAVLLKLVLEVILWIKRQLKARRKSTETRVGRALSLIGLALVLPGSKFVVLELVDLLFGDAVSLGGFWPVTALIVVLTLARAGTRLLFERCAPSTRTAGTDRSNEFGMGSSSRDA